MEHLSNEQGITNGYQLTDIDLSIFAKINAYVYPFSDEGVPALTEYSEQHDGIDVKIVTLSDE